jgi:hypothetical protein
MLNECDSNDQEDFLHNSSGKIQEEEFCRILDLRKNLQFSDVLIQHMSHYLSLGWHLAAINAQDRVNQSLDFQASKATWSEKLIELSLDGVELNVGVRTGSSSGLLVIEVHKQGRVFPFRRGDWSSECVAEAGAQLEQHYYELPEGWQLPASFALEPFEVKVFGEGNLVMAPPSLEPRTRANWRWLKPPWDSALSQPPPVLRKIIEFTAPGPDSCPSAPAIPSWEEVHPAIASHSSVLQALMKPASSPEIYYQHILAAAHAIGLKESRLLLGLLWHAPLGDVRERPQGWKYLQQLLAHVVLPEQLESGCLQGDEPGLSPAAGRPIRAIAAEPGRGVDSCRSLPSEAGDYCSRAAPADAAPPSDGPGDESPGKSRRPHARQYDQEESGESWQEFLKSSQGSLIVERRRYEAMIYELGKLQTWQEICKQERRENKSLNLKLAAQLAREVEYLRNLLARKA